MVGGGVFASGSVPLYRKEIPVGEVTGQPTRYLDGFDYIVRTKAATSVALLLGSPLPV